MFIQGQKALEKIHSIIFFSALPDVVNDSSGDALGNDSTFHQQWNNSGSNSVVIECSKSNTWQPNVHPFAHRTQQRYTNRKKQQQNNNNNAINTASAGVVVQVNTNSAVPIIADNEESLEDSFEKIIRSADHRFVLFIMKKPFT